MRLATVETRWFLPEELPDGLVRWFAGLGEPRSVEARVDHYLALDRGDLGIKQREGRFEVKGRTGERPDEPLARDVRGDLEDWVKWSVAPEEAPEVRADFVAVHKARRQRRYALGDGLHEVPLDVIPPEHCTLEIAQVETAFGRWWTLGLEAVPGGDAGRVVLREVAADLLADLPLPLEARHSAGYARWLADHG